MTGGEASISQCSREGRGLSQSSWRRRELFACFYVSKCGNFTDLCWFFRLIREKAGELTLFWKAPSLPPSRKLREPKTSEYRIRVDYLSLTADIMSILHTLYTTVKSHSVHFHVTARRVYRFSTRERSCDELDAVEWKVSEHICGFSTISSVSKSTGLGFLSFQSETGKGLTLLHPSPFSVEKHKQTGTLKHPGELKNEGRKICGEIVAF